MRLVVPLPGAAIICLSLVAATACDRSPARPSPLTVRVTAADNGRAITISTRDTITLTLSSNAATGYSWTMASAPSPSVLVQFDAGFRPAQGGQAGAPGDAWWTFTPVAEGSTAMLLRYERAWESSLPADEFRLNVTVKRD